MYNAMPIVSTERGGPMEVLLRIFECRMSPSIVDILLRVADIWISRIVLVLVRCVVVSANIS